MTTETKTAPTKTKTTKRGRPKGAKTKPKSTVIAIPGACPACHSTQSEVIKGSSPIERIQCGTLPATGQRFTSIVVRRKRCKQCNQVFSERSYQYDPSKW